MKKNEPARTLRICPICSRVYTQVPALSRTDNETLICPDCGTRQALNRIGIDADEAEKILDIVHRHTMVG